MTMQRISAIEQALRSGPARPGAFFWLAVAVLCLVAVGAYLNTLQGDFVYDDHTQVRDNPWIRDARHLVDIFTTSVWQFESASSTSNYYRPLMHVWYLLAYQLFGPAPWGFHLINILLHAAVTVLVFLLTQELLRRTLPPGSLAALPAVAAALLFAVHPIHTEVVAWIAAVPELSYSFFLLLSLYLYLQARAGRRGAGAASVISFALAALSKEPALTLPFILFLSDHTIEPGQGPVPRLLRRYAPYLLVAAVYVALRWHALGGLVQQEPHIKLSAWGYLINVFPLFQQYLQKLVLPVDLNLFSVFHPLDSLLEPRGLLSLAVAVLYAGGAVLACRRNRIVCFSMVMIVLPLLPALYIPALSVNVFSEHHLYLPSFGFALLFAYAFARLQALRPKDTILLVAGTLALAAVSAAGTVSRNAVWRSELALYTDTLKKSPDAVEIRLNLGNVYADRGQVQEAMEQYRRTLELAPGYAEARNNLGILYYDQRRFEEAVVEYRAALALKPSYAEAHNNLGNAYAALGRTAEAAAAYAAALELKPDYAVARRNLELLHQRSK